LLSIVTKRFFPANIYFILRQFARNHEVEVVQLILYVSVFDAGYTPAVYSAATLCRS